MEDAYSLHSIQFVDTYVEALHAKFQHVRIQHDVTVCITDMSPWRLRRRSARTTRTGQNSRGGRREKT